jgi:hypothetical protein
MVSIDEEHFLFQKYIEIFYSKNKKVDLLEIFQFLCILHTVFLLGTALPIRKNSITRKLSLIT